MGHLANHILSSEPLEQERLKILGFLDGEVLRFFIHITKQETIDEEYRRDYYSRMALTMITHAENYILVQEARQEYFRSALNTWRQSLLLYQQVQENDLSLS